MKFNFISINSNFGKHDSEENKSSTYGRTKNEIKLSSAVDGFFHSDKIV